MSDILMPKLSDTMEEGKIIRWLKQRGDPVAIGEILAEVETDKADMELEAFDEGVLEEIRTAEGESAPVGAVIAVLTEAGAGTAKESGSASDGDQAQRAAPVESRSQAADSGEKSARQAKADRAPQRNPAPATKETAGDEERSAAARDEGGAEDTAGGDDDEHGEAADQLATPPSPAPARSLPTVQALPEQAGRSPAGESAPERVRASPLARRIARERGVDLSAISGSGPDGRIVERDVELAGAQPAPASGATPRQERPVSAVSRQAPAEPAAVRSELGKVRRATARRMAEAKREVPHFYASSDVAMDECVRLKAGLAEIGGAYAGITYTHLVLKAVGTALRRVPEMNASFDGDTIVLHDTVHVGLATATDAGLVVPVVRDCDSQPLGALIAATRALVERARGGAFAGDDLRGATFTVSNLGMYPVSQFAAILNPPQAGILAVGAVRAVPVVRGETVRPGHVMTVTLSCDHRAVDGAVAGRFLEVLNAILEAPLGLVA